VSEYNELQATSCIKYLLAFLFRWLSTRNAFWSGECTWLARLPGTKGRRGWPSQASRILNGWTVNLYFSMARYFHSEMPNYTNGPNIMYWCSLACLVQDVLTQILIYSLYSTLAGRPNKWCWARFCLPRTRKPFPCAIWQAQAEKLSGLAAWPGCHATSYAHQNVDPSQPLNDLNTHQNQVTCGPSQLIIFHYFPYAHSGFTHQNCIGMEKQAQWNLVLTTHPS
jgi:hypothetical protein